MNAIAAVFATHRLATLIVEDEITRPVREAVFDWAEGAEEFSLRERVASALDCKACMSVWSGAAVLVACQFRVGRWAVGILAASGAALALESVVQRLER